MARYVDAEKLIFETDEKGGANGVLILDRRNGKTMRLVLETLKKMVDGLPTEDVAPVVHGRWCFAGLWEECSVCKHPIAVDEPRTNFCPSCGAKMDLEVLDGKS